MSEQPTLYSYEDQPADFWAQPHPAVVIGGGPIGLIAALGLVRRGIRTVVVEAGNSVSVGSRAICTSRHTLEVLDRLGAGDLVQNDSLIWSRGRSFHRDEEVLSFEMPSSPSSVRPAMVNISQAVIEQHLIDILRAEPLATVLFEAKLTKCTEHSDSVELRVATPAGERTLSAAWVVAADGARSEVRSQLGLRLNGTSYEGRYVIADIRWKSQWPTERKVWFDPASNPGSTVIMHEQPDDVWRVDYQLDDADDADAETQPERIRERIARHFAWLGMPEEEYELVWSSLYQARALSLDSYRHGRVLFAGDAAHLVPIFGVRGLNSGAEDASTLSWTLASVINGDADPKLLDAYAWERRNAWEQNIANAKLSTLFMTPGSIGYKTTRSAVLAIANDRPVFRNLINPRQSSATHAHGSAINWANDPAEAGSTGAKPGDPIPDVYLTADKSHTLLGEGGSGFIMVGNQGIAGVLTGLAEAFGTAFPLEGARAVVLDDETRHRLAGEFGTSPKEAFVIRPEGLLLARIDTERAFDAAEIIEGVRAGTAERHVPLEPELRDVEADAARVEEVWKGVSDALDATPAAEHTVLLAKLVLLLAEDLPEPGRVQELIALAQARS
ncbi:aromatic ring hydroxylase [Arthrobacter sp. PAMC25564]|uniref:FAD-dependent monooxygenase n=1 Tax=Arthrobacter sp. PAMC25564 TaxID=2565366 RepID=UPI0010A20B13|nr:FAD-dependent monooxygenase [Arthrobacter sp. PAMC25564]QCB97834.1 aromatic ring hydroxylase [Arthrobacter sp. PAMC25564]